MLLVQTLQNILEKKDFSSDHASFLLPYDIGSEDERKKLIKKYKNVENIALVGIGGSNLGTIAIHESLRDNDILGEKNISFFDTPDPEYTKQAIESIDMMLEAGERLLIIIISKSGTTTETIGLADILYRELMLPHRDQVDIMTISDPGSKLDELARIEGWDRLNLPSKVGGRYSVFSNVGLFPLELLGYNTDELLNGARDAIDAYIGLSDTSHIHTEAMTLFEGYNQGRHIYEHWFFSKKLESLGKWYRQLLAESIGKIRTDGKSIGITPTTAIGTIDLHSIAQLDLAHSTDKIISIVSIIGDDTYSIGDSPFATILSNISRKKFSDIMYAAMSGFVEALREKNIPIIKDEVRSKNAYDIGYWMQSKMLKVALLGELFEVDPFNQPNIEDYKIEMKKILN